MKYFGTDGIRQKADAFTPDFINSVIAGLATYADSLNLDHTPRVFLAGDTRESTEWILQDCENALESLGFEHSSAGVLPTPAINYCFFQMGFDFAIDITASHNPYTDNGIKIFERGKTSGVKLSIEGREFIESAIANHATLPTVSVSDRASLHTEAVELYAKHILNYLTAMNADTIHDPIPDTASPINLYGLCLGVDCADGAMSAVYEPVFNALNLEFAPIHISPHYGQDINHDCGSTHPESIIHHVKTKSLDGGIAFDGDGDRCLLVDEAGDILDGDQIIAILATYLGLDTAAVTVMSNQGLFNWAAKNHIHLEVTNVGDSNVAAAMREKNISLGGEQSGHVILPGEATGDGLLTALMVVKAAHATGAKFSDLARLVPRLPQVNLTLAADPQQKSALTSSDAVKSILAHFEENVKSMNGRLLVRPSGTENLIRITVWGDDEVKIAKLAEELKNQLKEAL